MILTLLMLYPGVQPRWQELAAVRVSAYQCYHTRGAKSMNYAHRTNRAAKLFLEHYRCRASVCLFERAKSLERAAGGRGKGSAVMAVFRAADVLDSGKDRLEE